MRCLRGIPVKRLKVIATQRKQKLPWPLWCKPGCSVEFLTELIKSSVFKNVVWKKNDQIKRNFFYLSAGLKSFIALNILSPNYRDLSLYLSFLKGTGSLIKTSNLFCVL